MTHQDITKGRFDGPFHVQIRNDGPTLTEANWWDLTLGKEFCFLTVNAGCFRLLVPPFYEDFIPPMKAGVHEIVISTIDSRFSSEYVAEILFDDHSVAPFAILLSAARVDRLICNDYSVRAVTFAVYVNRGKPTCVLSADAYVRTVPQIPCLRRVTRQQIEKLSKASK
jgi:hypothetical protein